MIGRLTNGKARSAASRDIVLLVVGAVLVWVASSGCSDNRTPATPDELVDPTFDCLPNLDGRIEATELPLALELPVDYLISAPGAAIDLVGDVDGAGRRAWDFTGGAASDERVTISAEPLAGKWYASAMSAATFVVAAADPAGLDGAYIHDERGLFIVGLASPDEDPPGGRTLLVYESPVLVLRFPIDSGDVYSDSGTVTGGTLDGLPYNGTDTYQVSVDGVGRAALPDVTFTQAIRVRTDVEIAPAVGGITTTRRQASFFFECFGEVVRVISAANEPNVDFTSAAEVRRFAL